MEKQHTLEAIAQKTGRPVQSLQGLCAQPEAVLQALEAGIESTLQREQARLETAYRQALPKWLYRLIMPWLRRTKPS